IIDEETDALRGRAFTLVGPASKVEAFTAQKDVIHRESLGTLVSATILGHLDTEDHEQAEAIGLEIAPVSLQQLIIHLTRGTSERKAAQVR
ncbi:MAG: ABC transporter ATP-binding protein, partial [Ktedonobacteraceae bacterium]|nr:ABC transporter ATP-binding protein [Ktedonobacteraceae bacterium]